MEKPGLNSDIVCHEWMWNNHITLDELFLMMLWFQTSLTSLFFNLFCSFILTWQGDKHSCYKKHLHPIPTVYINYLYTLSYIYSPDKTKLSCVQAIKNQLGCPWGPSWSRNKQWQIEDRSLSSKRLHQSWFFFRPPPNIKTSEKKVVLYIKKSIAPVFYEVVKKTF